MLGNKIYLHICYLLSCISLKFLFSISYLDTNTHAHKDPTYRPFCVPETSFQDRTHSGPILYWASHPGSRIYIISHKPLCLCAIFKVDKSEQVVG